MSTLYPIIRRARRSLLPPDDISPIVPHAVVESPPLIPPVENLIESAPVETAAVVSVAGAPAAGAQVAPVEPVVPVAAKTKRKKRDANPPA